MPYDFVENKNIDASVASCYTYIKGAREKSEGVVLLDNGDNLQGQPEVYYYNFIDTVSPHLVAEVMNFMQYDAGTTGNHDIEAGHSVYDRLVKEYNFPLLAANAVDIKTGKPYFKPYQVISRNGLRIAVFGMVTPAIPEWLPPELYKGMEFKDMVETAKKWMPVILREKPDLVVGLFHSGWDKYDDKNRNNSKEENGSSAVAYNVPGFDIIFNGHDHKLANEKFVNIAGDTLLVLDGGSHAGKMAEADVRFTGSKKNGKKNISLSGKIINVSDYKPDPEFVTKFRHYQDTISNYVRRVIGYSKEDISSRESYFGPSAFVGLIHSLQLEITCADVSFAAPLSFDVKIAKGPVTVGDMFKLYRFENMLYTLQMSGDEIRKYLEYSYSGWLNTMHDAGDRLLKLRADKSGRLSMSNGKAWLKNQPYNFDSAAGIDYTVDVSKPEGERVVITGFSDGRAFDMNKIYKVALNSYRGNGGGGHLTEGSGISREELAKRLLSSTEKDLRYYMLKSIEAKKIVNPVTPKNWKIIPEKWADKSAIRDYSLLFGGRE